MVHLGHYVIDLAANANRHPHPSAAEIANADAGQRRDNWYPNWLDRNTNARMLEVEPQFLTMAVQTPFGNSPPHLEFNLGRIAVDTERILVDRRAPGNCSQQQSWRDGKN